MAKMFEHRARTIRAVRVVALATAFIMTSPVSGLITHGVLQPMAHEPDNLASYAVSPRQTVIFKTL
jgi:hypothetical protein